MNSWQVHQGDVIEVLRRLPPDSVNCVVTSPPYWGLRDYGMAGQIGLEETPELWVAKLVDVFREVRRVLRPDGTCWVNLGDSYASDTGGGGGYFGEINRTFVDSYEPFRRGIPPGLKAKDLIGQPWRFAFAAQADGWWLRRDIIWAKPNPMPESASDRPATAHEYVFLLSKSERYEYDAEAVKEPVKISRAAGEVVPISGWMSGPGNHSAVRHSQTREDKDAKRAFNRKRKTDPHRDQEPTSLEPQRSPLSAKRMPDSNVSPKKRAHVERRNLRSVWTIPTQPFPEAHFATFPERLVEPCILAGCPEGGVVLDPFAGSGTTGVVALKRHRSFIGIELNPEYHAMAQRRLAGAAPLFSSPAGLAEES